LLLDMPYPVFALLNACCLWAFCCINFCFNCGHNTLFTLNSFNGGGVSAASVIRGVGFVGIVGVSIGAKVLAIACWDWLRAKDCVGVMPVVFLAPILGKLRLLLNCVFNCVFGVFAINGIILFLNNDNIYYYSIFKNKMQRVFVLEYVKR
jgi:hypothetical protein